MSFENIMSMFICEFKFDLTLILALFFFIVLIVFFIYV
jgi:hypothetical protein